jgi:hypothetical protein
MHSRRNLLLGAASLFSLLWLASPSSAQYRIPSLPQRPKPKMLRSLTSQRPVVTLPAALQGDPAVQRKNSKYFHRLPAPELVVSQDRSLRTTARYNFETRQVEIVPPSREPRYYRTNRPLTIHSTIDDTFDGPAGQGFWPSLFRFPTIGADPNQATGRINIPQIALPPNGAPFTNLFVAYGEIGRPAEIEEFILGGNVRTINPVTGALTNANGPIMIIIFDGVSAANPPNLGDWLTTLPTPNNPTNLGNIAQLTEPDINGPRYAIFFVSYGAGNGPGIYRFRVYSVPTDPQQFNDRIQITDPRGRYGILVAKVPATLFQTPPADDGPAAQWIWWGNSAIGPNSVWDINPVTGASNGLVGLAAEEGTFNQSAYNRPLSALDNLFGVNPNTNQPDPNTPTGGTLNPYYQVNGRNANGTILQTGIIAGNLRRRGVNIPAPNTPETAPGSYTVSFFAPGNPPTLVKSVDFFTQPSYDATGSTTNVLNFVVEGIPVGNYQILFSANPIFSETSDDTVTDFNFWPFSDFYPVLSSQVAVPFANPRLNAQNQLVVDILGFPEVRLDRFGDIAGNANPNDPVDGTIDLFDLIALFDSFGASANRPNGPPDPNYNPLADLVGTDNPDGFPDGIVDLFDLIALFNVYGLGNVEIP